MSRQPGQTSSRHLEAYSGSSYRSEEPNTITSPTSHNSAASVTQMALLPPPPHAQQSIAYRPHASYAMYAPHSGSYPPPQQSSPNGSQQAPNFPPQPAPRQRTAIACQYCRRRKIRCHGFDSSPQGKCTNCIRFHQECMFLPVSTQGQAFVPAHTAYPLLGTSRGVQVGADGRPLSYAGQPGGPVLYNHQGQPFAPVPQHDPVYGSHQPPPGPYVNAQYQQQPPLNVPPHEYYEGRGAPPRDSRLNPSQQAGPPNNEYPDPSVIDPTSPASSSTSYQNGAYPPSSANSHPYYQSPSGVTRVSPTTSYFPPRMAGPSHGSNVSNVLPPLPPDLHPPLVLPPGYDNIRNTSANASTSRSALSVSDMLTPNGSTRSSTDNDMLNALDRRRRR